MADGWTTSLYIPDSSDIIKRFDDRFGEQRRSRHIREAMELLLEIESIMESSEFDIEAPRERRAFVRQALLAHIRRESED